MPMQIHQMLVTARVPLILCGLLVCANLFLYFSGSYVDLQALLEVICLPSMSTLELRGALGFSGDFVTAPLGTSQAAISSVADMRHVETTDWTWPVAVIDAIRLVHLAAVVLGLGTVVTLVLALRNPFKLCLDVQVIKLVQTGHRRIACAICLLWISGLALIAVRTGFDPAEFSPKLWTKLVVVTILTIDAGLIHLFLTPLLKRNTGASLIGLAIPEKLLVANCAALSGASWIYALMLGASSVLKTAHAPMLMTTGLAIYGCAYLAALGFSLMLHQPAPTQDIRTAAGFGPSMPLGVSRA